MYHPYMYMYVHSCNYCTTATTNISTIPVLEAHVNRIHINICKKYMKPKSQVGSGCGLGHEARSLYIP